MFPSPTRIVIGADGLRSTVAKLVDAPVYRQADHACGVVYGFWPGLGNHGNRWYYREGVSAGAIPTNDGNTCLFAATPQARFHDEIKADIFAEGDRVDVHVSAIGPANSLAGGRLFRAYWYDAMPFGEKRRNPIDGKRTSLPT